MREDCVDVIIFLDDNGEKKDWHVKITKIDQGIVEFLSERDVTHILPMHRVLKIKLRTIL